MQHSFFALQYQNTLELKLIFEISKIKVHQHKALAQKRILRMFSRRVRGGKLVKNRFKNKKRQAEIEAKCSLIKKV